MIPLERPATTILAVAVAWFVVSSCARQDSSGDTRAATTADSAGGTSSTTPANAAGGASTGTQGVVPGTQNAVPGTPNANTSAALPADTTPLNIPVVTPGPGSSTRTRILDALRQRLNMQTRFKVDHIRMAGLWAFVRATEVVELDKGELQETDLTVSALLELPKETPTKFQVVEVWTLPDEQTQPFAEFIRKVHARVKRERLPAGILPDDFR